YHLTLDTAKELAMVDDCVQY
ncbi:antA/AntB antirepressor family protein, partial [Escherichia coli]|nr:antA/AntB antirepressor family protein [Escherichia coli]